MVHAWFFETPGSWRLGHPYTLQHQTDAITATRATDGTMYEGELVTDLSNYNGGCECQINDGTPGPWGRICLRSKTPPSGGWTCTGAGGAVPIATCPKKVFASFGPLWGCDDKAADRGTRFIPQTE